jgi:tetratricopeptide (TPR) repeat protein
MAEGLLGGVLGDEEEKPEAESAPSAPATDAFAAAIAAKLSDSDSQVARDTSSFLQKQAQLVETQRQHLLDEHAVRIATLHGQKCEGDLRRAGIRVRIAFQLFAATVAAFVGAGVLVLLHDAFTSRSVIVDTFQTPHTLEERGITGNAVAGTLLDELNRLQEATHSSSAAKRNLKNAWSNEVKLAVPESGISIADLSRMLAARFGHDLHIGGDLAVTDSGDLGLTIRGDSVHARSFTGPARDLNKLIVDAAQYVYSEAQPALWDIYLSGENRWQESIDFAKSRYATADPADRPYLLNIWGLGAASFLGDRENALRLYRKAIEIKPDFWVAYNNLQSELQELGREEEAWQIGQQLIRLSGGRPGRVPETFFGPLDGSMWDVQANISTDEADMNANNGVGSTVGDVAVDLAHNQLRNHDIAAAQLTIDTIPQDEGSKTLGLQMQFARGELAYAHGDVARAYELLNPLTEIRRDEMIDSVLPGGVCQNAPVQEAAGHPDRADISLNQGGTKVDCYRYRADVLDGRDNWKAAQAWYAKAVALAPDLPAAYYSWGLALARHGDPTGAIAKLTDAHQRGPHWADPLKAWGDVLIKQGRRDDALDRYNEAVKYAPNWQQLKEARETLIKHKS